MPATIVYWLVKNQSRPVSIPTKYFALAYTNLSAFSSNTGQPKPQYKRIAKDLKYSNRSFLITTPVISQANTRDLQWLIYGSIDTVIPTIIHLFIIQLLKY